MPRKILEVKNLTKTYKNRVAVDNLTFDVYEGEIFGFLGPNGAGKSTTIKMITGLATITQGDAYICGFSIKKNFEKAVRQIGGIIENPEMYSYMTGWDNLKFFANLYDGITDERIHEVVKLVGLENRIHDKFKNYSLGMKQRLGIAQSLLHSPKILILDEPTNGLDPNGIQEIRRFLKNIAHNEKIAVLISSHILGEMEQMCDTIGIIDRGKLVEIKNIDQIRKGILGAQKICFKVDYPNFAGKLIYNNYNIEVELAGNNVIFPCEEALVPKIIQLLINNNLSVFSINTLTKSLEDVFLDIIRQRSGSISIT